MSKLFDRSEAIGTTEDGTEAQKQDFIEWKEFVSAVSSGVIKVAKMVEKGR